MYFLAFALLGASALNAPLDDGFPRGTGAKQLT